MTKKKDRAMVTETVNRFQSSLEVTYELLFKIQDLLATEGEARQAIPDLYRQAQANLERDAGAIEYFRSVYAPGNRKINWDALMLGSTCATLIAIQIVSLNLFLEALSIASLVEGEDLDYLRTVVQSAEMVFSSHVSFVRSALRCTGLDIPAFSEVYRTGPGAAQAHEEFENLYSTEFPAFKARTMAQAAD